ncbi:unnamed protein product, partial [Phaeothamnion confervicola]
MGFMPFSKPSHATPFSRWRAPLRGTGTATATWVADHSPLTNCLRYHRQSRLRPITSVRFRRAVVEGICAPPPWHRVCACLCMGTRAFSKSIQFYLRVFRFLLSFLDYSGFILRA